MILCKLGIHRPLKIGHLAFVDVASGKDVRYATCPCGKKWLTDSVFGWFGYKTEKL
ncbi:MAG: hypothetical protein WDA59_05455 [Methanofastidiosum sp.]